MGSYEGLQCTGYPLLWTRGVPLRGIISPTIVKMTSFCRDFSQIPARIRNLYAIGSTNAWVPNAGVRFDSVLPTTEFTAKFTAIDDISVETMMRDMGKTLTLLDTRGLHYATLRLVQTIDGTTTEGVPANWNTTGQYYVSVWAADTSSAYNPSVVRSG